MLRFWTSYYEIVRIDTNARNAKVVASVIYHYVKDYLKENIPQAPEQKSPVITMDDDGILWAEDDLRP